MKTNNLSILKLLSVALSVFLYSFAFATEPGDEAATKDGKKIKETNKIAYSIFPILNTNKIRVAYQKDGNMPVSVKIYDGKINLLYNDTQRKDTYLKRNYNMDRIGSGEYVVKIEAGDYTTIQRLQVGKNKKQEFAAYLSPQLTNNKIRIAFQHATSPVGVYIYDEDGDMVYEKRMVEQNFSSLFNLSPLDKGKYTIVVSSAGKSTESTYEL